MTTYTVTGVRKVLSDDFSHRHLEGVCTDRVHYTVQAVADSIDAGNVWKTKADGFEAVITVVSECPEVGCTARPYLETNRRSPRKDNLENLGLC
ncbi:MAG: hypothetical protein ACRDY1_00860 [Acidimicrobiales bacterium]